MDASKSCFSITEIGSLLLALVGSPQVPRRWTCHVSGGLTTRTDVKSGIYLPEPEWMDVTFQIIGQGMRRILSNIWNRLLLSVVGIQHFGWSDQGRNCKKSVPHNVPNSVLFSADRTDKWRDRSSSVLPEISNTEEVEGRSPRRMSRIKGPWMFHGGKFYWRHRLKAYSHRALALPLRFASILLPVLSMGKSNGFVHTQHCNMLHDA